MLVHYVYKSGKQIKVDILGDDDLDRLKQLLARGCSLLRTPTDPIVFEERLDLAFIMKHLTDIFGPGTIDNGVYVPFSTEGE